MSGERRAERCRVPGEDTFQSLMVLSSLPLASVWPSGLKATECTVSVCPVSPLPIGVG